MRDVDVVERDAANASVVERAPWSPAQLVSLIIGGIVLAMGGIALARTGLNFDDLSGNQTEVFGLGHTSVLALIEIVVGLALIAAGAIPGAGRGTMIFFGVVMLGFGIVMAAEPSTFDDSLGTEKATGVFYAISGVLLILAAMIAPTLLGRSHRATARTYDRAETTLR